MDRLPFLDFGLIILATNCSSPDFIFDFLSMIFRSTVYFEAAASGDFQQRLLGFSHPEVAKMVIDKGTFRSDPTAISTTSLNFGCRSFLEKKVKK